MITTDQLAKQRERITRLLAKAGNNPSPHEARACQEHAERLMVRYGIARAELEDQDHRRGVKAETITQKTHMIPSGAYATIERRGTSWVIGSMDGVQMVYWAGKSGARTHIVGAEADVDQAIRLLLSLRQQAKSAMTEWWVGARGFYPTDVYSEAERLGERKGFIRAFYLTVAGRLTDLRDQAHGENTGTALIVTGRNERVREAMHELNGGVRIVTPRPLGAVSHRAAVAGRDAGEAARLTGSEIETQVPAQISD